MPDPLYWTARVGLVVTWLVVARLAWSRRQDWPRLWSSLAGCALVFASMRAWPWNYWMLETARMGLRQAGVYDDRIWFKIPLACALLVAIVVTWRSARRSINEPWTFACCLGIGMQGVLIAIETLSLDDPLPSVLLQQPGRYLIEGGCASLALLSLARHRETP